MMHGNLELEKKTYGVTINGNIVSFTIYGEEDDLDTLEMFIQFLLDAEDDID